MRRKQPLTWDDLANLYDQYHNGRKARTLSMETIHKWALTAPMIMIRKGKFYLKD